MALSSAHSALLYLLSCGAGCEPQGDMPELSSAEWQSLMDCSDRFGLSAVVLDGFRKVMPQLPVDDALEYRMFQWFGESMRMEKKCSRMWDVAKTLDKWWGKEGIYAVVLKGRSIAQYYPDPQHRYSCDIDVWIGEQWHHACDILEQHNVELCHEVYKEVEFTVDGTYVECHRYITPVRGNKNLLQFERYLRILIDDSAQRKCFFADTTLQNPPLMFTVMLYVEHALGDLLHDAFSLKHIADWMVLRRQDIMWSEFDERCKCFGFDRFVNLINALADFAEGRVAYSSLQGNHRQVLDSIFSKLDEQNGSKGNRDTGKSRPWLHDRIQLFFRILSNARMFREFGYCSMPNFLISAVWAHFFDKEVKL